ncbi:MAG: HAMP domain-containing histidine kinase [Lachnospiraceae bacterium]|nr:HAMP domain-containing histidine kinase [Lachnospiraceae bacterium]
MKIRWIAVIYTVVILSLLKFMLGAFGKDDFTRRDMVYYNDIIEQIKTEYDSGISVEDIEKKYNCDIILKEDKDYTAKLFDYCRDYGLVMDFEDVGKVCFEAEKNVFSDAKENARKNIIYIWIVILVVGYVLMFVLYYNYIRPFHELQHFTTEIAKGNLDITLPMHKKNVFGAFTESFDVMREELAASRIREAEAEKSKKELVAQLSHDIKTPVATIKATCEVLEMQEKMRLDETNLPEKDLTNINGKLEKIGYISNKADTIDELISNMFQATLEELEELNVKPVETDSRVIDGFFKEISSFGNIVISSELPECLVYMDKLRMEQVIGNVVGNSAKYAGTDIAVSYKISDAGIEKTTGDDEDAKNKKAVQTKERYLCITVRDYGSGIPDEDVYNVTEKFYRGHNSSGIQGSGLGLYLAKYFMEKQMGGFECYNHKTLDGKNDGFVVEMYLKIV